MHRLILCILTLSLFSSSLMARDGLQFIANGTQWPAGVHYRAELPGGAVFLTRNGFTYNYYSRNDLRRIRAAREEGADVSQKTLRWHSYSMTLLNGRPDARVVPSGKFPHHYNFILGADRPRWSGAQPAYEQVKYEDIYDGIDLQVYGAGSSLKYDLVVHSGADPSAIRLQFEGVKPSLTESGDLLIRTSVNELLEAAPYAYQIIDGKKRKVTCRYVLRNGEVSFVFENGYNRHEALIIDPAIIFVTYSGSTNDNVGWSATYDSAGNLYTASEVVTIGWPTTSGAFQTSYAGVSDIGIHKYSSNGSALVYGTYFGGDGSDFANSMVVNRVGELIVAGSTTSTNLPTTAGCFDNTLNGSSDVFVAHFNASGTALTGSTYLGGRGRDGDVAVALGYNANRGEVLVDGSGDIFVAFGTSSTDFPTTAGAYQTSLRGTVDAFVSKLDPNCSNLLRSTYLGGTGDDAATCIHLSRSGKIVIGGTTTSSDFPFAYSGWQGAAQGGVDGFIAVLTPQMTSLLAATYNGSTAHDDVAKLQVDEAFHVYAMGINRASFPVSPGTYSVTNGKNYIIKLDSALSNRLVSTVFGSTTSTIQPTGFLLDRCSNLYFVGYDAVNGLATTPNALQANRASFWTCVLGPDMRSLAYASYFGGATDNSNGGTNRFDTAGVLYIATHTRSSTLPTTSFVHAPAKLTTGGDMASWKIAYQLAFMKAGFTIDKDSFCVPATVQIRNTSHGALTNLWDFGDGSTSTQFDPGSHTYAASGVYKITLYTYNNISCKAIDSQVRSVYVFDTGDVDLPLPVTLTLCNSDTLRLPVRPEWRIEVEPAAGVQFQTKGGQEILFFPATSTSYTVRASADAFCINRPQDSLQFTIVRDTTTIGHIVPWNDAALCKGDTATYILRRKLDYYSITPSTYSSVTSDSSTFRFFPPVTTRYRFIGMNWNSCTTIVDTFEFMVNRSTVSAVFEPSPRLTDIQAPDFTFRNYSRDAQGFEWLIDGTPWSTERSPVFNALDTGTYRVLLVATDRYRCVDSAVDSVRMIRSHLYLPNAFSPNGDGLNDIFRPILLNVDIETFAVFNRFGQRVFITSLEEGGWDGKFNGTLCDMDVYFYLVKYKTPTRGSQILKGDVTLVR